MKIRFRNLNIYFQLFRVVGILLILNGAAGAKELVHIGYESGQISPQSGIDAEKPVATDSIIVDCNVARVGKCSLRSTLRRDDSYISYGNYRAETDTKSFNSLLYSQGDLYCYRFSFRTEKDWQFDNRNSIDLIWQFKRFNSHADMFVAVKGHDIVLRVLNRDQYIIKHNFLPGKWMDIMMNILWSSGEGGMTKIYLREEGEKTYHHIVSFEGSNMFNAIPRAGRPKWGLYKPSFEKSYSNMPRTVYHDEIFIDKLN